jgi:predicted GH43/DUF377 family glycosyl hydrolase
MHMKWRFLILSIAIIFFTLRGACAQPIPTTPPANAGWKKYPLAVLKGQFDIASDPMVIRLTKGGYRMYYTGLDAEQDRTVICAADSTDGLNWKPIAAAGSIQGLVLHGLADHWDENVETAGIVDLGNASLLLYTGYRDVGHPTKGFPSSLGIARISKDGSAQPMGDKPAIEPTPSGFDNDGIYHPRVIRDNDHWFMVYTAHAYTNDPPTDHIGVRIMGATSKDGTSWTKLPDPLLSPKQSKLPWTVDGVAEACVVQGPDLLFYLFFTGLKDKDRVIGLARSKSLQGPWEIAPQPILQPSATGFNSYQVLAPSVLSEDQRVRMWYTAVDDQRRMSCGYAEATWPIWP